MKSKVSAAFPAADILLEERLCRVGSRGQIDHLCRDIQPGHTIAFSFQDANEAAARPATHIQRAAAILR